MVKRQPRRNYATKTKTHRKDQHSKQAIEIVVEAELHEIGALVAHEAAENHLEAAQRRRRPHPAKTWLEGTANETQTMPRRQQHPRIQALCDLPLRELQIGERLAHEIALGVRPLLHERNLAVH